MDSRSRMRSISPSLRAAVSTMSATWGTNNTAHIHYHTMRATVCVLPAAWDTPRHEAHTIACSTHQDMKHTPLHSAHTKTCSTHQGMQHTPRHAAHTIACSAHHCMQHTPRHAACAMTISTHHDTQHTPRHVAHTKTYSTHQGLQHAPTADPMPLIHNQAGGQPSSCG